MLEYLSIPSTTGTPNDSKSQLGAEILENFRDAQRSQKPPVPSKTGLVLAELALSPRRPAAAEHSLGLPGPWQRSFDQSGHGEAARTVAIVVYTRVSRTSRATTALVRRGCFETSNVIAASDVLATPLTRAAAACSGRAVHTDFARRAMRACQSTDTRWSRAPLQATGPSEVSRCMLRADRKREGLKLIACSDVCIGACPGVCGGLYVYGT